MAASRLRKWRDDVLVVLVGTLIALAVIALSFFLWLLALGPLWDFE